METPEKDELHVTNQPGSNQIGPEEEPFGETHHRIKQGENIDAQPVGRPAS